MLTVLSIVSLVGAMYLGLVGLHEWHLYKQAARMRAVEECELASQLEPDTLTDSPSAYDKLFTTYEERSGVHNTIVDEDNEPTIPSARCPAWDMHGGQR